MDNATAAVMIEALIDIKRVLSDIEYELEDITQTKKESNKLLEAINHNLTQIRGNMWMNTFKQVIVNVQDATAQVESISGNIYPVIIADRVRLSGEMPKVNDIGIIHRVNGRYYLYDFESRQDETDSYLSEVPLTEMGYDY